MKKTEKFKRKVQENKAKIITGSIFIVTVIGGVVYVSITNDRIKRNEEDIQLLKDVMSDDIIYTLKESLKRRLRYAETKLNNALLNDNVITEGDIKVRKEEIAAINEQLLKLNKAEYRLKN